MNKRQLYSRGVAAVLFTLTNACSSSDGKNTESESSSKTVSKSTVGLAETINTAVTKVETGNVQGPITIAENLRIDGMISGDANVDSGVFLNLNGMITGNLTISSGAYVELRGTVSGSVKNAGTLIVYGVVNNEVQTIDDGHTDLQPGSIVNGERN